MMLQYINTYADTHIVFVLGVDRGAVSEARQLVGTVRLAHRRARGGGGGGTAQQNVRPVGAVGYRKTTKLCT